MGSKTKQLKSVLSEFARTTTISGLYFIEKHSSPFGKLLWTGIFLFLVALTIFQTTLAVLYYLECPTTVTQSVFYNIFLKFSKLFDDITFLRLQLKHREIIFPTVTFCSSSPIKRSKISEFHAQESMTKRQSKVLNIILSFLLY